MGKNGYVNDVVVPCRLSFVSIVEPSVYKGKSKYKVTCIIPKTDVKTIQTLNAAAKEAFIATFGSDTKEWPPIFRKPGMFDTYLSDQGKDGWFMRDGDQNKAPENAGSVFFTAGNAKQQPRVFRRLPSGKVEKDAPLDIIYSGCYASVMVDIGTYNADGNQGVTAYLRGVCFEKDGERFSGGAPLADDAFGEVEEGGENPDNYGF